ncbi:MAG: hypothetical protein DRP45_08320 [Candidatus Zixiibacteriota bacterium]|nr:MAG: hypothetical protein DRP45_08320 [candidate division Zixibacteria bacterium]
MRILDYLFAARPMLQLPIWTVYLVSLHHQNVLTGESFDWMDLAVMLGISLLFSAAAFLNQVYDYESDRINRKVGFLQKGILTRQQMIVAFVMVSVVALGAAPLLSRYVLILFAQFFVLAYIYSAPPLRLKDRAIGGFLANAYGHGFLVAIAVLPGMPVFKADLSIWSVPLYFALCVGATYILTTIPDRAGDAASGKRTLGVVLGRAGALSAALFLMAASAYLAFLCEYAILAYLSIIAVFLVLGCLMIPSDRPVLMAAKLPLLLLTFLAGYHYPMYLLFVVALIFGCRIYYFKRFGIVYPELA